VTPSCAGRRTDRHGGLAGRCVVCPLLGGLCFAPPVEVFVSCPQWRSVVRAPSGGLWFVPPVEVLCFVPPVEVFVSCPQWRSLFRAPRGGLCPLWRLPAERARGRNVPCTRPKRYGGAGLVSAPPCSLALAVRQRQLAPDKSLLRLALGVRGRSLRKKLSCLLPGLPSSCYWYWLWLVSSPSVPCGSS
jgi:hypothetical protein